MSIKMTKANIICSKTNNLIWQILKLSKSIRINKFKISNSKTGKKYQMTNNYKKNI